MSYRQKKALEIAIRDALDGMEALASMFSYRRLPDDLEILGIGEDPVPEPASPQAPPPLAEVIEMADFRPVRTLESSHQTTTALHLHRESIIKS